MPGDPLRASGSWHFGFASKPICLLKPHKGVKAYLYFSTHMPEKTTESETQNSWMLPKNAQLSGNDGAGGALHSSSPVFKNLATEEKPPTLWKSPKQNFKEQASLAVRACRSTTARRPRLRCTTQQGAAWGFGKGPQRGRHTLGPVHAKVFLPSGCVGTHFYSSRVPQKYTPSIKIRSALPENKNPLCVNRPEQSPFPRPEGTQLREVKNLHQHAQPPPNK